jgi:molybdenum cofactor cytidylyltransferase
VIFGEFPLSKAEGALLVHTLRVGARTFRKGRQLNAEDVTALSNAGFETVSAIHYEEGDVDEDTAAARIAHAAAGTHIDISSAFTGRVNLYAKEHGLLVYDRDQLDEVNLIDETATIATLPPFQEVRPKQMVATIKIIPFAITEATATACVHRASIGDGVVRIAPFMPFRAALIQTTLPKTKTSILEKSIQVLGDRLKPLGGEISVERRCAHNTTALSAAIEDVQQHGCDFIFISGASAITDRRDVIPAALEQAGGMVEHFGMPVDPGNLLLFGALSSVPVVGLPSCARSPKLNGFDWVLQRLAARVPVTRRDIMRMGAGGLLKEISSRPLPRATATDTPAAMGRTPNVAAIILAAGQSRRMGAANKMSVDVDGAPMISHATDAVLASKADPVIVVVGHDPDVVRTILADCAVTFVENKDFAKGLSTSVIHGVNALPDDTNAFLVCLGDMPRISADQIDRLIAAFDPVENRAICVPTFKGKWGNPILFERRFIEEIKGLTGDRGARALLDSYPELVCEVEMSDDSVLIDVDTPESLAQLVL